tara:strand:- start:11784 stop:12503 length:720 start_codon:yes stop_codon:yes gene_type:complete
VISVHPRHCLLLAACLTTACERDEEAATTPSEAPPANLGQPSGATATNTADAQPPPAVVPAKKGFDPPRLYTNELGVSFEVYELNDLPYDGKIVTYHEPKSNGIKKEELVYERGRLTTRREFWPNSQNKSEVIHDLENSTSTTNRWEEDGTPIQAAGPPPNAPKTRSLNWTLKQPAQIQSFVRQNTAVLIHFLGEPDERQGNLWTYRGMDISDFTTGREYTGVQFTVSGNIVTGVTPLP